MQSVCIKQNNLKCVMLACSYCSIGLKGNTRTVDVLEALVKCSRTCCTMSTVVLVWTENMQKLCNHHPAHCMFTVFLKFTNKNKPAALTSYMYEHLGVWLCSKTIMLTF